MANNRHKTGATPPVAANTPHAAQRSEVVPFCEQVLVQATAGIVLQDLQGRVEWMNPAAETMFGLTLDKVYGQKVLGHILPENARPNPDKIAEFQYDTDSSLFGRDHLALHMRADGSTFWNLQSFALIQTADAQKVAVTCRDVSDQVETEQGLRVTQTQLQHAAHHDDLTGLANRKRLKHYLESDLVLRALKQREVGVLQLDVDKFKEINDTLGHAAGDAMLVHVAEALQKACGPHDLACRSGGDEFLLVCLGLASREALLARAELVMKYVSRDTRWQSQTVRVGCSIGASLTDGDCTSGEILIHHADQALYAAKAQGRGRVVSYTPTLGKVQTNQNQLARDVRLAVTEHQLEVYLQPQLNLQTGQVTGCETLLRWNHPRLGQLAPGAFLDTARRAGVLADLDYHAMHLSLDALKKLHKAGFDTLTLSLNVSSEILSDANYPGLLDWALQSRGLHARQICVEIMETAIMERGGYAVAAAVERLKQLGTQVALDDFGIGYAGLAHMSAIEVDAIKLDRSMVARLEDDPRNHAIVLSVIDLCRRLNTNLVAEGVETARQVEILKDLNCPSMQGFALAHPMSVDDMIVWLTKNMPAPDLGEIGNMLERPTPLLQARSKRV